MVIRYFMLYATGDIIANEVSPSHLEELDAFLLAFLKEQGIPGASLVITRRGEPFHTQCNKQYLSHSIDYFLFLKTLIILLLFIR